MGLVFLHGDRQEQIPVLQSTGNLEYEISSIIKKMTSKVTRKVGLLTGHGEPGLEQMKRLQEMLQKQYEVAPVSLAGGSAVPFDVSVLLIVAPQTPFKSWENYLIDQYIMKGGKVAFLLNRVAATLQTQMGRANDTGLDQMLEAYGVRVNADLVRDVRCAPVMVQQPVGSFMMQSQIPFYYLPIVGEFSKKSPVVKDLGSVVFHFVSSVDTSLAQGKNLAVDVLARTSNRAGRQEQVFMINPNMEVTEEMFRESGIPLGVTLEGSFASAFANNAPVETDSTASALDLSGRLSKSPSTKVVVFGDGDFLQDAYLAGSRDNLILASNLVDWLADDIGLAAIRSRETGPKPLDEVEEGTRTVIKYLNLALPPLFVVLFGVMRWRWRVAMRRRLESSGM
jgi:gliding-associated putative ABC transporter substrate-binding component GldG